MAESVSMPRAQIGADVSLSKSSSRLHRNAQTKMIIIVSVMSMINVPAIIIALSGQSILQLFLLADLLCASAVSRILVCRLRVHGRPIDRCLSILAQ